MASRLAMGFSYRLASRAALGSSGFRDFLDDACDDLFFFNWDPALLVFEKGLSQSTECDGLRPVLLGA